MRTISELSKLKWGDGYETGMSDVGCARVYSKQAGPCHLTSPFTSFSFHLWVCVCSCLLSPMADVDGVLCI